MERYLGRFMVWKWQRRFKKPKNLGEKFNHCRYAACLIISNNYDVGTAKEHEEDTKTTNGILQQE